jgi:hypothetical protein
VLPFVAVSAITGCQHYHWSTDYQSAEDYARQQQKYLFIFYKWWLSDDSNRMHGDVISDPAVAAHLKGMVSVLLEKDSSPEYGRYMSKFGVTSAPAFVIVAPDGSYQVRTGFIPKDRFIEFIESARTARPARPGGRRPASVSHAPVIVP